MTNEDDLNDCTLNYGNGRNKRHLQQEDAPKNNNH